MLSTTVQSAVYGAPVAISVYEPPCYSTSDQLPVIYLLHGGNADETQWPDLRVQPEADRLIAQGAAPFVVVMPGGDYSAQRNYADFVLADLIPEAQRRFHISASASRRAIGGISLGGYWALKIAFSHPDLFAAVGGHSPVVTRGHADDPLALAGAANGLRQLAIALDVGNADALRTNTEQLAGILSDRRIPVVYAVRAGQHDRVYWRAQCASYLRWYTGALASRAARLSLRRVIPGA
jgi:enterochelin esterase-like enzyme